MRTLVHLSDLHFGRIDPSLVEPLRRAVTDAQPDLTVISGDFTQRARRSQFAAAREFLDSLKIKTLVVPGNHDIPLFDVVERFAAPLTRYRQFISAELEPEYEDDEMIVVGVTVPLLLALRWFVASTRQGKAMRATAQDREASGLMGIDVNRTISLTFLIAGGLAGAAGLVVALYYGQTFFQYGLQFGLLSFTAAVMGGIGNLTGATLGGLFVGIVAAMSDRFIEAKWTSVIVFSLLILVLIFRPTGLLAEQASERA